MSIRLRKVNGYMVALCGAKSTPKKGDIYLDDHAHHALTTKFGLDFYSMDLMKDPLCDPELTWRMAKEMEGQLW